MGMFGFDERYAGFDMTPVANQFIVDFMPTAKGDHVKVYLYGLMRCVHGADDLSLPQMARDLGLSEEDVLAAFRHWEFAGLVTRVAQDPPAWRYLHPTSLMLGGETRPDPAYQQFMENLYSAFSGRRELHGAEVRKAWEWVAELHLTQEVVLALVRHLISTRGENFNFSAQYAERLAERLADAGARTVEDAADVLAVDARVENGARAILRRFRQRRQPTQDEIDLYRKWAVDWGFDDDAIALACRETTKGSPTFGYLDGVLSGMRQRGAGTTGEDILAADREAGLVREYLSALGLRGAAVSDGTVAVYRELAAQYPHEMILLAAKECARSHGTMDTSAQMLASWRQRGLVTVEAVRAYLENYKAQGALMVSLGEVWGERPRLSQSNRKLLEKWQDAWGFSREMILHCAAFADAADRTMPYLDKLLEGFRAEGVTTPEAADAARAARAKARPAGQNAGKRLYAQQYTQREYTERDQPDMTEQILRHKKELSGNAK